MKYSIITPVYNRADCISRCIESVVRNEKRKDEYEIEHIIVDDGSSDDTVKIVSSYAKRYDWIKFISFAHNRGTNAARNAAISVATGDFSIILDSDDYFVDNALEIIYQIMEVNPHYGHYAFAADDMMDYYDSHSLLKDFQRELSFKDFLVRQIGGDFIHVIKTSTLKKFPFDEELRIFEGIFFLKFYKEAKKILFSKIVVTIRERNRADSVTKEVLLTNKTAIDKNFKAVSLRIEWFSDDYQKFGLRDSLARLYQKKIECALLLGRYSCISYDVYSQYNNGKGKSIFYKFIYVFRLGFIYRVIRNSLVLLKYNILKKKIR